MWFWILLVIVLLVLWAIVAFNGLVVLKNRVNEADSDIGVQLKRRHDLIPNLVNTVKGYAVHERELFERVTEARANAITAGEGDIKSRAQAENMLTGALKSLFAVVENYPELKANQNFLALQEELSETENKIMSARRFYNTNVRDYNIRREMIPTNIIANLFNFKKRDMFELEDMKEAIAPEVNFNKPEPPIPSPTSDTSPSDAGGTSPTPKPEQQPTPPTTPPPVPPVAPSMPDEKPTPPPPTPPTFPPAPDASPDDTDEASS